VTTYADRRPPSTGTKLWLVAAMVAIVGFGVIFICLRTLVFQPYTIPSASNEPTLFEGDYIIVDKSPFSIFARRPVRGDVIVFKLARDQHTSYVKRLIGMPGDHVQLRAGVVYVNGQPLRRQALAAGVGDLPDGEGPVLRFDEQTPEGRHFVIQKGAIDGPADDTGVYVVPPHCYFFLGDNRDDSLDSRFDPAVASRAGPPPACAWDASLDRYVPPEAGSGFVPEEALIGKVVLVVFSWDAETHSLRQDRVDVPVH
jgi:signal peptidase I